jgi:hypothetical protein
MRHSTPYVKIDAPPQCSECGTVMTFTQQVDVAKDGRAHFVFRCAACSFETKIWRPEWQGLTEEFLLIEI